LLRTLENKTAVVTGGGQGIGRGVACGLAAAGADVVITHLPTAEDRSKAQAVVAELRGFGRRSLALPMDVREPTTIREALQEVFSHLERLDILVNNAGVMQRGVGFDTTPDDFARCLEVNVNGIWNVTQALLPHFKDRQQGSIVNISSGAGRRGSADLPAYSASKAAVISLTQSLAAALAPYNVNVNCVCPGIVWTPMCEQFAGLFDQSGGAAARQTLEDRWKPAIPLQRLQTAEDIGHAVVFLASAWSRNITGQALNVDGGLTMS
jgi:meso-butanediol dehydrogenase / (S,S)-butanediol dehydrogenase / diacetyl reductase